jgi:hypothetical protein
MRRGGMSDKWGMHAVRLIVLAGLLGAAVGPAQGQATATAQGGEKLPGSRVIKTFDFEEVALGNFESVPMYWAKVVGKGYPEYSVGAFDHSRFRSSNTSFMLKTDGGSVAYRFTPPAAKRIPVHPNADYYVIAFVRTNQLKYARADITAWLADEEGNLMLPTEAHSQAYVEGPAAGSAGDAWQVLYVYVPGPKAEVDATAKGQSLVLQVGLMQPQQLGSDAGLGKFALYRQDVQGAVWFEDVAVFQLPRVGITPQADGKGLNQTGIFGPGEPVELNVTLSDLTGEGAAGGKLVARVRVTNPEGLVFAQEQWSAQPQAGTGGSRKLVHAPLPAGMYTAALEVLDESGGKNGGLIARRQTQFLCLPEGPRPAPATPEFGLGAAAYEDAATWNELPLLLRQTGAGLLQIPAWRRDMPEEALTKRDAALETLLAALQRQNVRVIGALAHMPRVLASRINPAEGEDRTAIHGLLNADAAMWRPYVAFLLTRYANRFDWWELGSPDEPLSGTLRSPMAAEAEAQRSVALYKKMYGEVEPLLSRQELVIPWNALFDFDATRFPRAVLDLRLPAVIKPSQLPAYVEDFRQATGGGAAGAEGAVAARTPIFVHLEGLEGPGGDVSREDRLADFAQRVVYACSAAPTSILLDVDANKLDELLLVYGTMIRALGGTRFEGQLPLAVEGGAGVKAFLFRKGTGRATVVLWTDTAGQEVELDLPLGLAPRTGDLLGNPRELKTDATTHLTRVKVSPTPVVLENVEPQTLELACSFALGTRMLPAGAGTIQTPVLLKNPFSEPLMGSLRLVLPKGWTADPPTLPVNLAAGGSLRQEVTLRYPFSETAGVKPVGGRLQLDAGNPTGMSELNLMYPVAIGSETVEMDGFTQVEANGDILLQQVITNTSGAALDAQAYAMVPGFPQQHRYVVGLRPNQTTIKRYTLLAKDYVGTNGGGGGSGVQSLVGSAATLGVRQSDGRVLLMRSVPIH